MDEWEKLLDECSVEEHEILIQMFEDISNTPAPIKENWFAEKQHHYQKQMVKAKEVVARFGMPQSFAVFYANNLAKCGCWMCTNPRRGPLKLREKLTLQEKISDINFQQQLKEVSYE